MAIHDQNYVRYEGPLLRHKAAAVIARQTLSTFWSFTRTKLTVLLMWLPTVVAVVLVFLEYSINNSAIGALAGKSAPGPGTLYFFMQVHIFAAAIVFMASGCGVIADDLRYRTFQLYFSKPLRRMDYALGKYLGLLSLGALVTVVPATFVAVLRLVFYARTEVLGAVAAQLGAALGLLTLVTAVMAAIVMGLSSLTSRAGYVVLSWVGVMLVPMLVTAIAAIATEGQDTSQLWSLPGNAHLGLKAMIGDEPLTVPAALPFVILLSAGGLGLGLVARRVSRLEGVA